MKDGVTLEYIKLFQMHGEDFKVWKLDEYYYISVEGYIGFKKLEDFIWLYNEFLSEFKKFLNENYKQPKETIKWKTIYRTRGMEICYESNNYWIFLEPYKSHEIWDLYDYMQDVINQIKEVAEKLNGKG